MMQASPYPAQPGMGPGHPGMVHHPMQAHHGGHMGQPNPAMMGGMHPGMSGPQVTQGGPMASMPPNPGTPAPGPMGNAMAMAHLGAQGPMFQGNHPQMGMQGIGNGNMMARQRMLMNMQNNGQLNPNMINMQGMHGLNPQQIQHMKNMNVPMQQLQQHLQQQQQQPHMTPQQQQQIQQQQQMVHQQRMMAQHAQAQNQMLQQHRQQAAQQQALQATSQQMTMSRSNEPATQPPQPQPTPAPQTQPQPQPQTQAPAQPTPQQTPQQKPQQAPPPTTQPQQQNAPTPQVKQSEDSESETKPDIKQQPIMMDMPVGNQDFAGGCILALLSYYNVLASPERPQDLEYWQDQISKYYSPVGTIRQQVFNNKTKNDKTFHLRYESLARFYHSHFKNGVKSIMMQSLELNQQPTSSGGYQVFSRKLVVTHEYHDGIRIMMEGSLSVTFDDMQKIENLNLMTRGWTEFIPRPLAEVAQSPEMIRQSPKLNKKNLPKNLQRQTLPKSPVGDLGITQALMQYLEIAEVVNSMGSLMEYSLTNQIPSAREALYRYNTENAQMTQRSQNMNAAAANGQMQFQNQRMGGMNPPNQFASPAFAHLNLPQNQQSPHMNHTPSPGHQGGVQMVHQMSAQGSTMSGSGPSTNTSPATGKRRRQSQIKEEDAVAAAAGDRTKPSPRVTKRAKGAPA